MRWVLSRESREVLKRLMTSQALLAFDFDGTLAPIVEDPERARMRPSTRRLLSRLAGACPCIVISGRSRSDVRDKLAGTGICRVVGNHGAEPWEGAPAIGESVAGWNAALTTELQPLRGLRIEDKTFSVTVHYRHARSKARARARIFEAAAKLEGARPLAGKLSVSIVPENAPNKGVALQAELDRLGCAQALYVGDDATDEDVFALGDGLRLLTVRVGRSLTSRAAYFIRSQGEIDELLRGLLGYAGGEMQLGAHRSAPPTPVIDPRL